MHNPLVSFGPRAYEVSSVVLVSTGVNIATGALDWSRHFPLGVAITVAGVLLFLTSIRIAYYREVAIGWKEKLPDKSLGELTVLAAENHSTRRPRGEDVFVAAAIVLLLWTLGWGWVHWRPSKGEDPSMTALQSEVKSISEKLERLDKAIGRLETASEGKASASILTGEVVRPGPSKTKAIRKPPPSAKSAANRKM